MKHTIKQAEANFSQLVRQACTGEEVVITRGNRVVVKLVPIPPAQRAASSTQQPRRPGALKGKISYAPDAFDPLTDQELKDSGLE